MMRSLGLTQHPELRRRVRPVMVVLLIVLMTCTCLAAKPTAKPVDPNKVERNLHDILSQPEYNQTYADGRVAKWVQKALDAVGRFMRWMGEALSSPLGEGAGKLASFIFASLIVVAFLALLTLIIVRLKGPNRARAHLDDERSAAPYDLPSSGRLLKEAARFAEAGDFRSAFRCAYLASISHLDETKALRFECSRTNWEYMRQLASSGHDLPHSELRPLTSDFDRKIYGRERCDFADYERALAAYRTISEVKAA